jgi:autotransporter-associated beta strand protein
MSRQNILRLILAVFFHLPLGISARAAELGSQAVDLNNVRLLDSRFKQLQDLHRAGSGTSGYLNWLDPDRLLYQFRREAGLAQAPGATSYGGWESDNGFVRGHLAGHYLTATSRMYAATGDTSYLTKINEVVTGLAECQTALDEGGYLSAFPSTWFDNLESGAGASVPYYTIHKIMAGLVDAYRYTGNDQALDVAVDMSDYFAGRIANLTSAQIDSMFHTDINQQREFGSMSEVLTDLYVQSKARGDTNYQRHLTLANVFNRDWFVDPLVNGEDRLSGLHANTHIAQAVGLARYANVAGDDRIGQAAENFWNLVVRKHSFANGGNSFGEYFRQAGEETGLDGASLIPQTAETCNVYNMLKLTRYLMERNPQTAYAAYYEQALYNQILPSIAPDTGMMTYYQSLEPGHFKTYNTPEGACWCCVGTGIENTARFNEAIYFQKNDDLWINLFIPSQVNWTEKGIVLQQEGEISKTNTVLFTLTAPSPTEANLNIRVPSWADGPVTVRINGENYSGEVVRGQYLNLDRQWQDGDQIEVTMTKKLYLRRSMDDPSMVSVFYGPILLAGTLGTSGMPASDQATDPNQYSGYSDPEVPAIDTSSADPTEWLQLVDPDTLTFQIINGGSASGIYFSPYYDVHHQRYSVYWKLNAPSGMRTWRGGGEFNDWTEPTNWDLVPCSSDTLQFDGATTTVANNNFAPNTPFGGVIFANTAASFTLNGNAFTLNGDIINNSANPQTINAPIVLGDGERTINPAAADITLAGSISGPGKLIKAGPHTLTLSGETVATAGGATVQQGTLRYNCVNISGDITNLGTVVFDQTQNGSLRGKILGAGNVLKTGSATLALLDASSYTGSTTIEAGTLRLEATRVPLLAHRWSFNGNLSDSVGASNATIVDVGGNNATLSATQVTLAGGSRSNSDYVSLGSNLLPNNDNPLTLEFWATQLSVKNWSRIFDFGSSTSENLFMSWSQGTDLNADRVEWVDSAGKSTVDNSNAPYALSQEYHIVMVIEPGVGQGGSTRVTWYSAPSAGGTLDQQGSFETSNTLAQLTDSNNWLGRSQYSWDDTANAAFNEVRIWQDALTYAELQMLHAWGTDHSLGPEEFTEHGQLPATTSLHLAAGACFDLNDYDQTITSLSGSAGSSLLLGSGTLTVGGDNTSTTFSGDISGAGGIIKTGAGTLTLDGDLLSVGSTSITGGVLQVNSLSASMQQITGSGALIVGDGAIAAQLSADLIAVSSLTIGAGAKITLNFLGSGGMLTGFSRLQAVPEPASCHLLILAGLMLLAARYNKLYCYIKAHFLHEAA